MSSRTTITKLLTQAIPNSKVGLEGYTECNSTLLYATGETSIKLGQQSFQFSLYVAKAVSFAAIQDLNTIVSSASQAPLIVVLQQLSEKKQAAFRSVNLNYIDAAANAWIQLNGLYVDRTGFENTTVKVRPYASTLANCFADKATVVIRQLFKTNNIGVQELARHVQKNGFSITPGYVSKVATTLQTNGYLDKNETALCLINKEELLQDWVEAYRRLAHPKPDGWYCYTQNMPDLAKQIGGKLQNVGAFSERSGAWFASPYAMFDSINIAAKDTKQVESILQECGAEPVSRGANIFLGVPKYKQSAFYDCRSIDGVSVVSDLQLYLDLSLQSKRGTEAMQHLFATSIQPLLKD